MKIAITAKKNGSIFELDKRFGRAEKFILFDGSPEFEEIDNTLNLNAAQGAGIQSAENIIESGAEVLITGHVGPKAFKVLNSAGIKIYCAKCDTVAEALTQYKNGELEQALTNDVEGHA